MKKRKMVSQFGRDKSIDQIIGANIKRYRSQRGISQEKLSTMLGPDKNSPITFQQVQKYENGTNAIAACRIPYLCRALGITLDDLFAGTMLNPDGAKPSALHELSPRAIRMAESFDKMDDRLAGKILGLVDAAAEAAPALSSIERRG